MNKEQLEKENEILKDKIEQMIQVVRKEGYRLSVNAYSMAIGKSIIALVPKLKKIAEE
jgi:hypothetical protein